MRVQLAHVLAAEHLADPDDVRPLRLDGAHALRHLARDLGRVRLPGAQHDADARCEVVQRPHQVDDPLLARDAPDEQHVRHRRIDAVALQRIGRRVGPIEVRVDAVVDDVHPGRVEVVEAKHVTAGAVADRDDRIGRLDGGPLDPRADVVPAAELLALPRAQRLE